MPVPRFKKSLSESYNTVKVPSFFTDGKRKITIIHTKLRHHCILYLDLYKFSIIESRNCLCGLLEDAYMYKYTNARNKSFLKLLQLDHFHVINTHLLLWGDESLSTDVNNQLVIHTRSW